MELWLLVLAAGLAASIGFAHRYKMNPDALSYLEVGESWWRGDFSNAVNGYWSPLFPILIAGIAKLSPNRFTELIPIHFLQAALVVAAFLAFRWFARCAEERASGGRGCDDESRLNFYLAAYAVFFWACFCLMDIGEILPDLLLTIWLLLAGGTALRLEGKGNRAAFALGFYLALGYLSKPVMFPLGLIFIVCSVGAVKPLGKALRLGSLAVVIFLGTSALYIIPLSLQKHRATFSDSGRLAYAWEVNRISPYFHWHGEPIGSGAALHPTGQILDFPPVFEFDRGRPGTYPLWYDASYWNEGLRPALRVGDQLTRLGKSTSFYVALLQQPVPVILIFSFLLAGTSAGWSAFFKCGRHFLPLALISFAAFGLYALVYVISRYLAPFLIFLAIPALATLHHLAAFSSPVQRLWARIFALFAGVYVVAVGGFSIAHGLFGHGSASYSVHARVAHELQDLGVKPGDKIGVIGVGCYSYFARLLGVQITAEALVLDGHPVWPASRENLEKITSAIAAKTRVSAIVSSVAPGALEGWHVVPGTPYCIWIIKKS
ncbi:MAG TPA: hypothetical protein VGR78_17875 [Verrucomicrobiae bacterium]|jgi:hypothetical protein|nr:hypothetical protein [Verrucomicrobiae bacterium]